MKQLIDEELQLDARVQEDKNLRAEWKVPTDGGCDTQPWYAFKTNKQLLKSWFLKGAEESVIQENHIR